MGMVADQRIANITKNLDNYNDLIKAWEDALIEANANAEYATEAETKAENKENYSIRDGAEKDIDRALSDKNYTEDVYLTDMSPSIITSQKGTKNLPMLMSASHIRENILSESEAKAKGLKVDKHTHYHGLGKPLFMQIIDGLNDVTLAYRGTKNAEDPSRRENYFLLISQYKDKDGYTVNVPVYINRKGQYNRVFIDTNKIATVFGRDDFDDFIKRELAKGNLVRIKNRSNQVGELTAVIADSYGLNASTDTIPQTDTESQEATKKSLRDIKNKYADVTDVLALKENDNDISIDNMVVKEDMRNKGIGQKILNDIISYADSVGKRIILTPTKEFGTGKRLTKWYKDNGFVENKGRNADLRISDTMYRLPKGTKYSTRDSKSPLEKGEWASFNQTIMKNNQRDNLRIGDTGAIIPTDKADTYKVVSYYMDNEGNPVINDVYLLEDYDYNIHSGQPNLAKYLIELEEEGASDGLRSDVLQPYVNASQTILRRYNKKSGKFVSYLKPKGTRGANTKDTGVNRPNGKAVSQGDRETKVNYSLRDSAYLSAVESGNTEEAQRMVDQAALEFNFSVDISGS